MVRLVISDLDGTLFNSSGELPKDNLCAIERLADAGIEFVPASGRAFFVIPRFVRETPATHYVVSCNGVQIARVSEHFEPEVLNCAYMDTSLVSEFYEHFKDRQILFDVMLDGKAYAERTRWDHLEEFIPSPAQQAQLRAMRTQVEGTVTRLMSAYDHVEKVTIFWKDPADRDDLIAYAESIPELSWTSSMDHNLEFGHSSANKGAALTWLANYLGIDISETLAFGDGLNDVSMLRAAGTGVAMGNAFPEALAAADVVTADCDHAGVARYLEQVLS